MNPYDEAIQKIIETLIPDHKNILQFTEQTEAYYVNSLCHDSDTMFRHR